MKKSSQSRRMIKQQKAEKKKREREEKDRERAIKEEEARATPRLDKERQPTNVIDPDLGDIKFKDTTVKAKETTWTVSGREAEALHFEEDDEDDEDSDRSDDGGSKSVLQSGFLPSCHERSWDEKVRMEGRIVPASVRIKQTHINIYRFLQSSNVSQFKFMS